ncbi:peroxisomal membrane protein PEX14 isoform X2 [Manihot esculenta]|uniref:Peroxisomal membrane protein PEX14 n=1 Tax=Manihot esculenta TaxID=3983 RepID=A0A2C9UJN2_MANES|nr:peroxisomal membrane protein PEX14 isoform X2 [Manihot esculenta]OAY30878.1 hypothetical protein MANES_14G066000v8 [Manihot esculenta]
MATESSPPPSSPPDDKPQTPELAQPTNEIQQHAREEAPKQSSPSVFVNSEPMREEQVSNAVKFLSHPKVRGSPVMYRRSFLERKGLTKEEIDEAFRRVPDPPPSTQATGTNQEAQVKSTSNVQPPAQTQAHQPAAAAPTGAISSVGTLRSRFHWYHVVFALGLLTASGAGTIVLIKNAVIPRLKSWIRKVVLEEEEEEEDPEKKANVKPSLAEEAAAAAKAAAAAAADVAKASQEMLNSKNEERRYFNEFMSLLDVQVQEMKSMNTTIRKLEGQTNNLGRTSLVDQEDYPPSVANHPKVSETQQTYMNGKVESDLRPVTSSSAPTSAEPSVAPHPKSYMEIMAMVQRGERPANIRDINDQPPNPNQQISNTRLVPKNKPWETGQRQTNNSSQLQVNGEGLNSKVQDNGVTYQFDSESTTPWWQQKNARITEIESEDLKDGPYGARTNEPTVQRTWVPPQPPPVAMPEAAEAIRRPKSSVQKEQLPEDQSASHSTEVTDELQRITKISESGSAEVNVVGSELSSSEIQEE